MEWIADYWFVFVGALIAVMVYLGSRSNAEQDRDVNEDHCGTQAGETPRRGGHGCCH